MVSRILSDRVPGWREHEKRLAKEMRELKSGRRRLFHKRHDVTAEQIVAKSWELHCLRQLIALGEGRKLTRRYLG